jgi:hypothetical protein
VAERIGERREQRSLAEGLDRDHQGIRTGGGGQPSRIDGATLAV